MLKTKRKPASCKYAAYACDTTMLKMENPQFIFIEAEHDKNLSVN